MNPNSNHFQIYKILLNKSHLKELFDLKQVWLKKGKNNNQEYYFFKINFTLSSLFWKWVNENFLFFFFVSQ